MIKFADFLQEIPLAITLEPFTQIECSFHKKNTFVVQHYLHSVQMSVRTGGVKLSCTNFGLHFFQSIFGTIL